MRQIKRTTQALLLAAIGTWLIGCAGSGTTPSESQPEDQPSTAIEPASQIVDPVDQLLERALLAPPSQAADLILQAARLRRQEQAYDQANSLLQRLEHQPVNNRQVTEIAAERMQLAIAQGQIEQADFYQADVFDQLQLLPPLADEFQHLILASATLNSAQGQLHQAALQHARLIYLLDDPDLMNANHQGLWHALRHLPESTLEAWLVQPGSTDNSSSDWHGWLELSLIAGQLHLTPVKKSKTIANWQQYWPAHPASLVLPEELQQSAEPTPAGKKTLLLLPLSGKLAKVGRAIQDGFMASYFQQKQSSGQLQVVDTGQINAELFPQFYQQQLQQHQPDLVVGPLDKSLIEQLKLSLDLTTPNLALNRVNPSLSNDAVFQFGLMAEDEVNTSALRLRDDGHRSILLLAPDTSWGKRTAEAFINDWKQHSNQWVQVNFFKPGGNYSNTVKETLTVDQSRQRAKQLQVAIGQSFEFEPRRRKDIDAILLLASPKQARQIKPLLAFHYAADLPVYGTSRLYSGSPNPERDRDLNKITFAEIPWILSPTKLRQSMEQSGPIAAGAYQRFIALGADAYQLGQQLDLLRSYPGYRWQGFTGSIHADQQGVLHRQLDWATIVSGVPQQQVAHPAHGEL